MSRTVRTQVRNGNSGRLTLWLEPWGEDYGIDPDETLEIVVQDVANDFYFQIDLGDDLKIWAEGEVGRIGVYKNGSMIECGYKRGAQ